MSRTITLLAALIAGSGLVGCDEHVGDDDDRIEGPFELTIETSDESAKTLRLGLFAIVSPAMVTDAEGLASEGVASLDVWHQPGTAELAYVDGHDLDLLPRVSIAPVLEFAFERSSMTATLELPPVADPESTYTIIAWADDDGDGLLDLEGTPEAGERARVPRRPFDGELVALEDLSFHEGDPVPWEARISIFNDSVFCPSYGSTPIGDQQLDGWVVSLDDEV